MPRLPKLPAYRPRSEVARRYLARFPDMRPAQAERLAAIREALAELEIAAAKLGNLLDAHLRRPR
jgi:hypothetical protein